MARAISFEQAKRRYPHRYTMEHVPAWARRMCGNGLYYAPQYRTDAEWYAATVFHGESDLADKHHCFSSGQTWPLGRWLKSPFNQKGVAA